MDTISVASTLRQRYPALEEVSKNVFRAVEEYVGAPYAVRYFDLSDNLSKIADHLGEYQDDLLGKDYFDSKAGSDLRWNNYLYFLTSREQVEAKKDSFPRIKRMIESNREYARKLVVQEGELGRLLEPHIPDSLTTQELPPDLVTTWTKILDGHGLGFILDEAVQVPGVVRLIVDGRQQGAQRPLEVSELDDAEKAATKNFIQSIHINGFRRHPICKNFEFGTVNLIVGVNGVGKTSLLEAVEYLYCGKTRRSERYLPKTHISAVLQGAGLTLESLSSTNKNKLRSRHLGWYGKNELRTLTIEDSFSKFNFLNTDAAVDLSIEESEERIGSDVTQILLGAQTGKVLDRLNRVQGELKSRAASIEKDKSYRHTELRNLQERLKAYLESPKISDQLFSQFHFSLIELKWRELPDTKIDVSSIGSTLQTALARAELLERLEIDSSMLEHSALNLQCEGVNESIRNATELGDKQSLLQDLVLVGERRLLTISDQLTALNALEPYVDADLENVLTKRRELTRSVSVLTANLAGMSSVDLPQVRPELLRIEFLAALNEGRARLAEKREAVRNAKRTLENFEESQAQVATLYGRLRVTAQEILRHVENPDHCPLCHTEFKQGQLIGEILSNAERTSGTVFDSLQAQLQIALKDFELAQADASALETLAGFLDSNAERNIFVADVLEQINQMRDRLAADQSELERVQAGLLDLEKNGLTEANLDKLKGRAKIQHTVPSSSELLLLKQQVEEEHEKQRLSIETKSEELENLQGDVERLCRKHDVDLPISLESLVNKLRKKLAAYREASAALQDLSASISTSPAFLPTELIVSLQQAQSLYTQLMTAISQEAASGSALEKIKRDIDGHNESTGKLDQELSRVDGAQKILNEMLATHSKESLVAQILSENGVEISRIFSSIHSPNEFDLRTDASSLSIVRREGDEPVGLNEMSTGQRAAYALSLFLSMNARLANGPKVLLFDDPIANVDDINVLSFLDYLRELAMTKKRQIFFATADTKLAGLFRHKFRFLGNDFREISLQREA